MYQKDYLRQIFTEPDGAGDGEAAKGADAAVAADADGGSSEVVSDSGAGEKTSDSDESKAEVILDDGLVHVANDSAIDGTGDGTGDGASDGTGDGDGSDSTETKDPLNLDDTVNNLCDNTNNTCSKVCKIQLKFNLLRIYPSGMPSH